MKNNNLTTVIIRSIIFLTFILPSQKTFSQVPYMVKDIVVGSGDIGFYNLVPINNGVIFAANDGISGIELWYSDGTNGGTNILKDINPGSSPANIGFLFKIGNKVYFSAYEPINGTEIWETDGTTSGTNLVKDLNPGSGGTSIQNVGQTNTKVFFSATTSTAIGSELYVTDGTTSGTYFIKDIYSGAGNSNCKNFIDAGSGNIFFVANDGINGEELWKSDGTSAGTQLVKDIRTGSGFSNITMVNMIGNILFFKANDGVNGSELWRSDGTIAGTYLLNDINPGSGDLIIYHKEVYNNKLFFFSSLDATSGNVQLWESDGTISGTIVNNTVPGLMGTNSIFSNLFKFNNELYFFTSQSYYPSVSIDSIRLFKITNTITNISHIKSIGLPYYPHFIPSIKILQENAGKFLFHLSTVTSSQKYIGISDGTAAGTMISHTSAHSFMQEFNDGGPPIPFVNNKWVTLMDYGNVAEFHTLDATTGSSSLLKDINPSGGPVQNIVSDWYYRNLIYCNKMYFVADDGGTGPELWESDGTTGGTKLTLDIFPGASTSMYFIGLGFNDNQVILIGSGDHIFFYASNGINGFEVWAIQTCNPIGINEINPKNKSIVYPNPTTDKVKINSEEVIIEISIYDVNGKLIKEIKNIHSPSYEINVSDLRSGLYLAKISGKKFSYVKFVKE